MAQSNKSLMRSLGQFVGHIAKGLTAPTGRATTHEVRRSIEEEERETPAGRVTLRRTVIEEITLPPASSSCASNQTTEQETRR